MITTAAHSFIIVNANVYRKIMSNKRRDTTHAYQLNFLIHKYGYIRLKLLPDFISLYKKNFSVSGSYLKLS